MLGRLKTSKNGAALPTDWIEGLSRLLNETYNKQCDMDQRYFDVYGQIYKDELLVVVSYLSEKDLSIAPITLFLSCAPDQMSTPAKVKKAQQDYIELAGLFFDEIFGNSDWDNGGSGTFEPSWQEVTHNNQNYHYKLSRENINLTLEANKLLGDDFEDVEFEADH